MDQPRDAPVFSLEPEPITITRETYPSVEFAYPLATASYETALQRLDTLDGRVQGLMSFTATLMLAIPALASSKGVSFRSGWFMAAVLLFIVANLCGIAARSKGTIQLLNPASLYKKYLHLSEWEFKSYIIYWAGKHFEHNTNLLKQRQRYLIWMLIFFLAETVALAVWAVVPS
jgi:hypothetical protein